MQAEPRNIVKSVLGRENLLDVPKDEIRRLAEEYPYSPVIQYLLTRRLQLSSDPGYGDSAARTAVYFNNPHWLSQLLRRQTDSERTAGLEESLGLSHAEGMSSDDTTDTQLVEERNDEEPIVDTAYSAAEEPAHQPEGNDNPTATEENTGHPVVEAAADIPSVEEPASVEAPETFVEQEQTEGNGYLESVDVEAASIGQVDGEATPRVETGWTGLEESDNDDDASSSIAVAASEEKQAHDPGTEASPILPEEPAEAHGATIVETALSKVEAEEEETHAAGRETDPAEVHVSAEPLGETEEVIPFEPLHTQDYFASLGVSLEAEPRPTPQVQVQSFTGWLQSMRPVHQAKTEEAPAPHSVEEEIRQGAEASNEEELILTEAMAEVFAKQGLRLKAIDVYRKLSLLHPDKSSIFAARIEQLKGISS